ncbi:sugar transporter [Pseudovirgaria hyperparasitica]|uniref:Sugar transporter n=1 Tax=Pseudovirgaria hyperparasitica TaxID=470096 RepID=A0A6A6W887_9PEZI|nr:sugar transporter [Pseudovirgaria hyperparasitica]KAF2758419.1 sugar transporter [Pseudovirgaria hyperparasitica]
MANEKAAANSDTVEHLESSSDFENTKDAAQAAAAEHQLTLREALVKHRKAAIWSAIISLTVIMEGYDVGLIYQFFAYPAFQKQFGTYYEGIGYQVSGPWQAGLSNGANAGIIIGGFANGYLSQKFGYKKVMLVALFILNWFIFIFFFAKSPAVLVTAQVLAGLMWGVFATSGPAYASEVCPMVLRGYLTNYINLCWCIGQLIAAGVLYGALQMDSEWSYRVAYGVQWAWPLPLFCIILFAPESPWWLVKNKHFTKAKKALRQLGEGTEDENKRTIAQIIHTLQIEDEVSSGSNYIDCFKGSDRRRTEIVCMTFAGQVLSGSAFAYGPTYFFEQAGISTQNNYKIAVGGTSLAFICNVTSWFLLGRFGRRTLYTTGLVCCSTYLFIIGILGVVDSPGSQWGQVALCLLWLGTYTMTVGPICFIIISETSSIRLRAKSICLSRNAYNITQIVANVIHPYMINPTEGNWKGKAGFFWCGTAALTALWAYFRLPELRGRSYEEADVMFHRKVSAREFASYKINVYEDELEQEANHTTKVE